MVGGGGSRRACRVGQRVALRLFEPRYLRLLRCWRREGGRRGAREREREARGERGAGGGSIALAASVLLCLFSALSHTGIYDSLAFLPLPSSHSLPPSPSLPASLPHSHLPCSRRAPTPQSFFSTPPLSSRVWRGARGEVPSSAELATFPWGRALRGYQCSGCCSAEPCIFTQSCCGAIHAHIIMLQSHPCMAASIVQRSASAAVSLP